MKAKEEHSLMIFFLQSMKNILRYQKMCLMK